MKSADAPTPAHDTHTPAGEVVLLTIPPESDPAVMRDPGAWRPTFDLERGYWVERAELLNEVDRLTARMAELEAGLGSIARRSWNGREDVLCWCHERVARRCDDERGCGRLAALLAPPEAT